ncbi:DUF2933 domain-containing protein [Ensifer adhaerens]|uniref:DUF2933 domain-containing protein n=1 Tax=Ensifer adhaerens TaxID=106592 RepID=UPI001C4DF0A3|nr:DUF2933 domain-containing protein [Ensifer adhaerens]MBW0367229.1 DUF2933 domain-containing protein [Ensifer adhaerens]UCM23579.1 DUF2933 domain-containing protein [Ensifer adhaerens]
MTWDRRWTLFAASLAVIAAFFFLREHWQHVLGFTPYLILLACPLMHFFHGGHGSHGGHGAHRHGREDRPTKPGDIT